MVFMDFKSTTICHYMYYMSIQAKAMLLEIKCASSCNFLCIYHGFPVIFIAMGPVYTVHVWQTHNICCKNKRSKGLVDVMSSIHSTYSDHVLTAITYVVQIKYQKLVQCIFTLYIV